MTQNLKTHAQHLYIWWAKLQVRKFDNLFQYYLITK